MKPLFTAVVMHVGWECDNEAWVIENEQGDLEVKTTSHGGVYTMSMNELDEKIKETKESLDGLLKLKEIFETQKAI